LDWVALALTASLLVGAGSIVEKQLVSRYLHSSTEFLAWLGLSMLPHMVVLVPLFPIPDDAPMRSVWLMLGAGFFWGSTANLMYRALRHSEASRVWPVMNAAPVVVAILAVTFLGETLGGWQWAAIVLAVSGTVLISVHRTADGGGFRVDSTLGLLLIAASLMATGQVLQKAALDAGMSVSAGFWLLRFGLLVPLLAPNLRPVVVRQMAVTARRWTPMAMLFAIEIVLFPVAVAMFVQANALASSVALVATLFGTIPVWVLIFATALSTPKWNVLNEPLDRDTLGLKVVAVGLIVGGVAGIALL
jgi:drug/metabolite transporter (DMT)-like permease